MAVRPSGVTDAEPSGRMIIPALGLTLILEHGGAGWTLASLASLAVLSVALALVLWAICRLADVSPMPDRS